MERSLAQNGRLQYAHDSSSGDFSNNKHGADKA